MSDIAIQVENLSKRYRIGLREEISDTFVGAITTAVRNPLRNLQRLRRLSSFDGDGEEAADILWALKDVSFEVPRGEVLGIIGRNGAGKSTLLKILSRITPPTSGRIELNGRVSSLLEVGTGFHPELTGRENIYLNGTILGMRKTEIDRKLEEIIDFSGVEKFIDTPVKRYSSGMRVRLAFSVAAHLEPEILLIDEVLAVGDVEFQKKCLGKMDEVAKGGRSVLFVSHNMASLNVLCDKGMILDEGELVRPILEITSAIDYYTESVVRETTVMDLNDRKDRVGGGAFRIVKYELLDESSTPLSGIICGEYVKVRLHYSAQTRLDDVAIAISFDTYVGEKKLILWTESQGKYYQIENSAGYIDCSIPKFPLTAGTYLINIFISSKGEHLDWVKDVDTIIVSEGDFFGIEKFVEYSQQCALVDHFWE